MINFYKLFNLKPHYNLKELDSAYDRKIKEIQRYKLSAIDSLFMQEQLKVFYYKARVHLLDDDSKYIEFNTVEEIPKFLTEPPNEDESNYSSDDFSDDSDDDYTNYGNNGNFNMNNLNNIPGFENFNEIFNKNFGNMGNMGMGNGFHNNFNQSSSSSSSSTTEKTLPDGTKLFIETTRINKNGKIHETKAAYKKLKDGTIEPINPNNLNEYY